jgi:hypothetical protein
MKHLNNGYIGLDYRLSDIGVISSSKKYITADRSSILFSDDFSSGLDLTTWTLFRSQTATPFPDVVDSTLRFYFTAGSHKGSAAFLNTPLPFSGKLRITFLWRPGTHTWSISGDGRPFIVLRPNIPRIGDIYYGSYAYAPAGGGRGVGVYLGTSNRTQYRMFSNSWWLAANTSAGTNYTYTTAISQTDFNSVVWDIDTENRTTMFNVYNPSGVLCSPPNTSRSFTYADCGINLNDNFIFEIVIGAWTPTAATPADSFKNIIIRSVQTFT